MYRYIFCKIKILSFHIDTRKCAGAHHHHSSIIITNSNKILSCLRWPNIFLGMIIITQNSVCVCV